MNAAYKKMLLMCVCVAMYTYGQEYGDTGPGVSLLEKDLKTAQRDVEYMIDDNDVEDTDAKNLKSKFGLPVASLNEKFNRSIVERSLMAFQQNVGLRLLDGLISNLHERLQDLTIIETGESKTEDEIATNIPSYYQGLTASQAKAAKIHINEALSDAQEINTLYKRTVHPMVITIVEIMQRPVGLMAGDVEKIKNVYLPSIIAAINAAERYLRHADKQLEFAMKKLGF